MSRMCVVTDCDSHDPIKGCMVHHRNKNFGPLACGYGQFVTHVSERFGDLGDWQFRSRDKYSNVIVATLRSKGGRVEIWGGTLHRPEVWAVPKGTDGCLISTRLTRDAVEMACGRVGIPIRMEVSS